MLFYLRLKINNELFIVQSLLHIVDKLLFIKKLFCHSVIIKCSIGHILVLTFFAAMAEREYIVSTEIFLVSIIYIPKDGSI